MLPEPKAAEMFYKFDRDPDGYKLPYNRDKLNKKPIPLNLHFFYNTPGIIKWNEGFPGRNSRLFKHPKQTDVP